METKHAIFTEGALFSGETINPAMLRELNAQIKGGREIIITTTAPSKSRDRQAELLQESGVVLYDLVSIKHGLLPAADLLEKYNVAAVFDTEEDNIKVFKEANVTSYLVGSEGKVVITRGGAPKAGKGTGRKQGEPSKVVPIRVALSQIEKYGINGVLLKKLINRHMAEEDAKGN